MENFDDTIQKARDMFDAACKKTGEVVSLQKMKMDLASKKGELNKAYATLGRLCYSAAMKDENPPAEAFDTMKTITEMIDEIEKLKINISKAQGKIICKNCNSGVPQGSSFCNFCGEAIK